jgi:tetratricopeptide (TPR) repeat protein
MILLRNGRDRAAALDYARRAVEVAPELALAQCALGIACRDLGIFPNAISSLRTAVRLAPTDTEISRQLGMTLVQAGNWLEGWQYYENRPTTTYANGYQKPDPPGIPEWRGENLSGKALIVLGENGHGDQIQSLRFIDQLLELPLNRLLICVRPALMRLVEHSLAHYRGGDRASVLRETTADGLHYKVATDSLAHRFGADGTTLPGTMPYLFGPPSARAVASKDRALRVGMVWRGERHLVTNAIRSIPLGQWAPLVQAYRDVRWVSLQHDDYDAEEKALLGQQGVETPLQRRFDFLDTAAVIAGLDLVISIDTAVAHLAGAMGKPVWLLNRASSEWRWGWKQTRTPWYPTMQIFHQESLFKWEPVIEEIQETLKLLRSNALQ